MRQISNYLEKQSQDSNNSAHLKDLYRFYLNILEGRISTRQVFSKTYNLRSSSVSDIVNELISKGLIYEVSDTPVSRGRPAKKLILNHNRIVVFIIRISSQTLICSAVNITGQVIEESRHHLNFNCSNQQMIAKFHQLHDELVNQLPENTSCAAFVFSIPGALIIEQKKWLMSSRWPKIDGLSFSDAMADISIPIYVTRNLDSELRARVYEESSENVLLLHWGFGIGIAYSEGGEPVNSRLGQFGEIGHWHVGKRSEDPCRCGRKGCLEVSCALWSIWPDLVKKWPGLSEDEEKFTIQAQTFPLLEHDKIKQAINIMVATLGNICRTLFPSKVLLSGPFFANDEILAKFYTEFLKEGVLPHVPLPKLTYVQKSEALEIEGATIPLISNELERILSS